MNKDYLLCTIDWIRETKVWLEKGEGGEWKISNILGTFFQKEKRLPALTRVISRRMLASTLRWKLKRNNLWAADPAELWDSVRGLSVSLLAGSRSIGGKSARGGGKIKALMVRHNRLTLFCFEGVERFFNPRWIWGTLLVAWLTGRLSKPVQRTKECISTVKRSAMSRRPQPSGKLHYSG